MSRLHHRSGSARSWQFQRSDTAHDPSLRFHHHGPIQPMEYPRRGLWARLFGRA